MMMFRSRSPWVYFINTGSCNGCDIEVLAIQNPRFNAEQYGILRVASPRHADVLVVTGPVTKRMADRLTMIYDQIPNPKAVVAVGSCPTSNGIFDGGYSLTGPLDTVIPVDVYVMGCAPRPRNILDGIRKAAKMLDSKRRGRGARRSARFDEAMAKETDEDVRFQSVDTVPEGGR
jgi:membrane-bound hydrogenase subunit mbhJ